MLSKGDTWNESQTHKDPITGRTVRRITTQGDINYKPAYHTRTTFTDDSEFMVFSTYRSGQSTLCRAHVSTGEITVLVDPINDEPGGEAGEPKIVPGAIAPRSGWAVFWREKSLVSVNIHSLEERVLLEGIRGGLISIDTNEEKVISPVGVESDNPALPDYSEKYADGTIYRRFIELPLAGGDFEVVYEEEGARGGHCEYSPVDPDLVLIDRDKPPMFHAGGDHSKSPRSHILNVRTGELTPLLPRPEAKFQIHAVWSWDGELVLYHGPAVLIEGPCPWYIGAVRKDGEILREWVFVDGKHYGHVGAAPNRPAIILDGNVTPDQIGWLYYDAEEPRFEPICEHKTEWKALEGQFPHPHPSTDRLGRWIAFNVARAGRTDVWVVEV